MTNIVIVGAGIIGLSTALCICESGTISPDSITVVANYFPDDSLNQVEYTSAWAGAHFRPFPSKNSAEEREWILTRITQRYFKNLVKVSPESSVEFKTGVDYVGGDAAVLYKKLPESYTNEMEDFQVLEGEILNKMNVTFGASYKQWVVNPPIYLNFLMRKLLGKYGVNLFKSNLNSLKQVHSLFPEAKVIINCSGQGLQYNGGYDPKSFPIRGQTLLIAPPLPFESNPYYDLGVTHQLKDGLWTFCITRPFHGGVIIGGTKLPNDLYNKPRDKDTQELMRRALKIFPELMKSNPETGAKYFDVTKINVGFRPAREGGLRLESESVSHKGKKVEIIHAYGAGGSGYELSYGVATRVNEILRELLIKSKL